jgi:hypothetical protein
VETLRKKFFEKLNGEMDTAAVSLDDASRDFCGALKKEEN